LEFWVFGSLVFEGLVLRRGRWFQVLFVGLWSDALGVRGKGRGLGLGGLEVPAAVCDS